MLQHIRTITFTNGKRVDYGGEVWELLTNATVVDDAIRFVSNKPKENLTSSSGSSNEESNELDYDDETKEINKTTITTNEVFQDEI